MRKEDPLLPQLTILMNTAQPIKLFNTYRGMPISYDARITAIDQGCVILNVHKYQAVCMFLDSRTSLISPNLPDIYDAQVISLDVTKRQAVLAVFKKLFKSLERRGEVRVQPENPIPVELWVGAVRSAGKLADISISGLGVVSFGTFVYTNQAIEKNATIQLEFSLPGIVEPLRVKGKAVHAALGDDPRWHRLGMEISLEDDTRTLLQNYVDQREVELLREVSFIYDSMLLMRQRAGAR
ncbi:MAG TPA: PilZ domain-containing protein [Anaerolineales bacterium]|nr:PilZ domain-containing protein [Anaerolineales bacterium]